MEQEADFFHLFTQHQLILFILCGLVIIALLLGIGFLIGRRSERKRRLEGGANEREK